MKAIKNDETLEIAVKTFANELPYWAKYLADKILSGKTISDKDINASYSYLLEELEIIDSTEKPDIIIKSNVINPGSFKANLVLSKLEQVEGVNALTENQIIEFCPNLTIIYGGNGSGKSGYVRLLKKAFYSKSPEEILPNIHIDNGHKPLYAKLVFKSSGKDIPLEYPINENLSEFKQFAVFDGKSVFSHLEQKNEFEFRPAGLKFFSDYTEAVIKVEQKLNAEVETKRLIYNLENLTDLFEGESEIKSLVTQLSASTKQDELEQYIPFTEEDRIEKARVQKEYDEQLLVSKRKEKEIGTLEHIEKLLFINKKAIEDLESFFSNDYIDKINSAITDCVNKETRAKTESTENFIEDTIQGIGTLEWKDFILAAKKFSKKQKKIA